MATALRGLLAALGFWLGAVSIATAQVANWPQTLPPNTVVGRLNVGPGPAQAVPIGVFEQQLFNQLFNQPAAGFNFVGIAPIGNTYPTDSAFVLQATPAVGANADRRFLVTLGEEPGGTAGSGGNEGNVVLYTGMDCGEVASVTYGYCWSANFLTTFGSHYNGAGGYTAEFDLNDNLSNLPAAAMVGVNVTSGGTYEPSIAYVAGATCSSYVGGCSSDNRWNVGFQCNGASVLGFCFVDESRGSVYSYYFGGADTTAICLCGTSAYGLDGNAGTFSADFIRGPSGTFKVDGSGNVTAASYSAGATAGASCSGSPTSSFASVNGIVTHC